MKSISAKGSLSKFPWIAATLTWALLLIPVHFAAQQPTAKTPATSAAVVPEPYYRGASGGRTS